MDTPWLPIATAPEGEDVVLTDCGTARRLDAGECRYWGTKPGWYCCDMGGSVFECADNGISGSRCEPTYWMKIPTLPR